MKISYWAGLWSIVLAMLVACGRGERSQLAEVRGFAHFGSEGIEVVRLRPGEPRKESAAIVRGDVGEQSVLILADEDDAALAVLDAETGEALLRQALWCAPHQLLSTPDGHLFATHPRCNAVSRYQLTASEGVLVARETARRRVASEPTALASSPSSNVLLVVSSWGRRLTRFDLARFERNLEVELEREPRAVSISDDGTRAWVAHAVGGTLSEVSLSDGSVASYALSASSQTTLKLPRKHVSHDFLGFFDPEFGDFPVQRRSFAFRHPLRRVSVSSLPATQGFALVSLGERVFVPQTFSNPGELGQVAHGYGAAGSPLPPTLQDVAVFDALAKTSNRAGRPFALPSGWSQASKNRCRLPRAAAFDAVRGTLLVACIGSDRVVEYDALARDPGRSEFSAWTLPRGPTGIALDSERRRAYVWSRFARTVSVLRLGAELERTPEMSWAALERRSSSLPEGELVAIHGLDRLNTTDPEAELVFAGMALFHRSNDPALSRDGRACASCHPAARDDGLVWRTSGTLALRQTPMLDGRIAGTAPYGWQGQHATLEEHLQNTIEHRLHGSGITPSELAALAAYLRHLPGPPRTTEAPDEVALARVQRGAALYHHSDVGCADCHDDDGGVDGMQHPIAKRAETDTPSLRFVAGSAPFFHDGKYETLDEVVLHTQGIMGQSVPLNPDERSDLVAFLRTL